MSYVLNKIRKDYFSGVGKRTRAQTDKYLVTLCRLLKSKKNGDSKTPPRPSKRNPSSINKVVVEDRKFVSAEKETEAGKKNNNSSSGEERKTSVKNEVKQRKDVVKKEGDSDSAAGKKNRGGFDSKSPAFSPGLKFHGQLFKGNDAFKYDDVGSSSSAAGGGGGFGSSRVKASYCESKKRGFGDDDDVIEVITIEEENDEVIEIEEESDDEYFPY